MDSPNTPDFAAHARKWLAQDPSPQTRAELAAILAQNDTAALRELFDGRLRFGTAGLRAQMGPGPKRINALLLRQSVLGIAKVLQKQVPDSQERGVLIGYDGRHNSRAFAEDAAGVLLAAGFDVHLIRQEIPTPVVGYWVRQQRMACGLMVTASHNPPKDNGLKIFWHDGAQISPPVDAHIAEAIDIVAAADEAPLCWQGEQLWEAAGLRDVTEQARDGYLAAVRARLPALAATPPLGHGLCVAYTPLHGVGAPLAEAILAAAGVTQVHTVAAQRAANGDFPGVPAPNPEEPGAMHAVLQLAQQQRADLACANDPDADRLAAAARDADGEMAVFTGDELGLLFADHLLQHLQKRPAFVATTYASSRLLHTLARSHGAASTRTLTGFKWLSRAAKAAAARGDAYVLAYEEALGYAVTDLVWDKDGISALGLLARLASLCHARGQTLWHRLAQIHARIGLGVTGQQTIALRGEDAKRWMTALRQQIPTHIGGYRVAAIEDGLAPRTDAQGQTLPASDALFLYLAEHAWPEDEAYAYAHGPRLLIRPSGTEPKVKIYYEMLAEAPTLHSWHPARVALLEKRDALMKAHQQQICSVNAE